MLLGFLTFFYLPLAFAYSPVGTWTTIDDKTGQKRAEVRLELQENGELTGKILKVYKQKGDTGVCKNCPGSFKNKPIKGLTFLWGLQKKRPGLWTGGHVLDAKSGKIYNAKITVKENRLYLRGYMGLSMLGRTQVWVRNSKPKS